jgi:hypothetical protein
MAVSRAVIKTLSDIRDFRGVLRKQHGAIFRQTVDMGRWNPPGTQWSCAFEDGLRIAGCRWGDRLAERVTHVDSRMRPGGHQACGGYDVERWLAVGTCSPLQPLLVVTRIGSLATM